MTGLYAYNGPPGGPLAVARAGAARRRPSDAGRAGRRPFDRRGGSSLFSVSLARVRGRSPFLPSFFPSLFFPSLLSPSSLPLPLLFLGREEAIKGPFLSLPSIISPPSLFRGRGARMQGGRRLGSARAVWPGPCSVSPSVRLAGAARGGPPWGGASRHEKRPPGVGGLSRSVGLYLVAASRAAAISAASSGVK